MPIQPPPFLRSMLTLSIVLWFLLGHQVDFSNLNQRKPSSDLSFCQYRNRPPSNTSANQYLVKVSPGWSLSQFSSVFSKNGLTPVCAIPGIDVWLLDDLSDHQSPITMESLLQHHGIEWVETNSLVRASGITPNDVFYLLQQENLRVIRLPDAWSFTTGDETIIAIIDTGIDLDHVDLKEKLWENPGEIPNGLDVDGNGYIDDIYGWDFVNQDAWPQDDHSHGSHVAGITAASSDNTHGITGISWRARIMPLKALNSQGEGTYADVAAALIYAVDNGAKVLNLSLGSINPSNTIKDAVDYAVNREALVIAASGNGGAAVEYPAAYPEVVAVAATDNDDLHWPLSNYGPEVDVAAPGVNIFSADRQGFYYRSTGTSMSTAHVSGLASLIWSLKPDLTPIAIRKILTSTTEDVGLSGYDERTGWGRIDAQSAIFSLAQPEISLSAAPSRIQAQGISIISANVTDSEMDIQPQDLTVSFSSNIGELMPEIGLTNQGTVTTTFQSPEVGAANITASIGYGYTQSIELQVSPFSLYLSVISKQALLRPAGQ